MNSNLPSWTGITAAALLAAALVPAAAAADAGVAYVSNERAGIDVIDLATLTVQRHIALGTEGPRGIAVTADGRYVLAAVKGAGDLVVVDSAAGTVARTIPIGKNPEMVRIAGGYAFVTYEPQPVAGPGAGRPAKDAREGADARGGKQAKEGKEAKEAKEGKDAAGGKDDDGATNAEVAVVDLATWSVVRSIRSGHETEGIEFSPDGRNVIVTNEGDNTVSVYDRATGKPVRTVATVAYGERPRGIKVAPDGKAYIVTLESSDKFLVLDADFNVVRSVPTKAGPYGVAYDPDGKRLFVAASRSGVLQVFDAASYAPLGEVAVGQRCWHFAFAPDGATLLAACGRSNAVYVVDARELRTVKVLDGAAGPWGIVTYPRASGTLDAR